jgi:hypothetical protein
MSFSAPIIFDVLYDAILCRQRRFQTPHAELPIAARGNRHRRTRKSSSPQAAFGDTASSLETNDLADWKEVK